MNNTLTWLHLSDLHLTCKSKDKDWTVKNINQDIVIYSLLEAIDKLLIKKGQKPDIIFITGDLAHGGKSEEYQIAEEFCRQLLEITGLSKQQLFIVPGNHDVNRVEVKPLHIKSYYQFNTQDEISELLSDSDIYPILMRKLEGFYKFANDFLEQDNKPEQHYIFAKPIDLKGIPLKINLLGLNSALFAGYDGDDKQKLAFGLHQSKEALQGLHDDAPLSIAFFHHPFSCFHDCEKTIQNQLKQKVDLILTGHLHDPSNMSQHDAAGKVVIIGAGASYETRESENSFNVGVLDLETGKGKIQFYKYIDKQNRWTKNTDVNLDEDDGHFPFVISSLQERPITLRNKESENPKPHETLLESYAEKETTQQLSSSITASSSSTQFVVPKKIAILTANPINKKYDYSELLKGFKKLKCEVDYFYLSCAALNELDGYDYIFILSNLIKSKIVIEDDYLNSRTISLKELEENICNTDTKGIFIFLDQQIDTAQTTALSLPTVIFPSLSKNEIESFVFQAFRKCKIASVEGQSIINEKDLKLCELNGHLTEQQRKTPLPEAIDPKTTQHYVGRVSDLEAICKKIIDLKDEKNGFLTIKGSGGLGKTITVKKIAVALAARSLFPDGIDFVDCEFISDYKLFEFNLARTFNLEQSINVKEHIRKHQINKNGLLILDNFETLLHLPDVIEIKDFLCFICDYVTVVVTSRELLELECEQYYELRRFTTDEAIELFLQEINRKITDSQQKLLRNEIIETLLDNNPLAIKLITKNLPKGKSFEALKEELEEDIFQKLTDTELQAFDSYSDTNIERKKSLYASINFSYRYLNDAEKMTFELLSLFPDGIYIENLKRITEESRKKRSRNKIKPQNLSITDAIINSLDNKSVIENNNGVIRLQSIVGRFAEQKLSQRDNMQAHYQNAFDFNFFLLFTINKLSDECLALKIFNNQKNNFLKSISYIDAFGCEKDKLFNYLDNMGSLFIQICTNKNFIKELIKKKNYFSGNENEKLNFELLLVSSRYFDGDFENAFKELIKKLPKDKLEYLDYNSNIENAIGLKANSIYGMEGEAYFCAKILTKTRVVDDSYDGVLFYIGEYDSRLSSYVKRDFFFFEIEFNCNRLSSQELDKYLGSIYEKNHIEIMSCFYIKAKMGIIDKALINKLVIVNPYTQGLQQLIFAFCETDTDKAISLYEDAKDNLKHIKYYYVEALFYYAKFLKEVGLQSQFEEIYQQGFELAQKHYFRFLIYKFEDLVKPKTIPYDLKNYPLPDNTDFDDYINFLIKSHQKQAH